MAKKYSELRAKMPEESRARAAARTDALIIDMQLRELRRNRQVTQVELARALDIEQGSVSKIENREDMYVSTLREYIKALGGELKLVASFADVDIQIIPSK